eukprot:m.107485 g.107485  ORF g.107485 m.107485 type:complete len:136 (+) comp22578_c0_seq4:161-568(+)
MRARHSFFVFLLLFVQESFTISTPYPYNLTWPPTYNMSLSTLSNPNGNASGLDGPQTLAVFARYGIITFDGSFELCLNLRKGPPGDFWEFSSRYCRLTPCFSLGLLDHVQLELQRIFPSQHKWRNCQQQDSLQQR